MRRISSLLSVLFLASACSHAPLRLASERRFSDGFFSGFSSRVVEYSQMSTDGRFLYFGTKEGRVYSVSAVDGAERWCAEVEGSADSQVGFGGGRLFVGTSKGRMYALRETDGTAEWHYDVPAEIVGRPVVIEGTLLFGANDGVVYALSVEKGELQWRHRRDQPDRMTVHGFAGIFGESGVVYTAFSDGGIAALKLASGDPVWTKNVPSEGRFPDVTSLLLLDGRRILAGQFDGALYALDGNGHVDWTVLHGGSVGVPVLSKGWIVAPMSGNRLALLDPAQGNKKWEFDAGETARWSGLSLFGPNLLAASYEGKVYVLDPETGKRKWTYDFGAAVAGAPAVVGEKAWVLTRKGRLFSLLLR
jgi:outer membrane protein assembly factor BamB